MSKIKPKETLFQKEKRLKARKQTFKTSYKKGVYYNSYHHNRLIDYLTQPDVLVRVINAGSLDDDKSFITITIEGFEYKFDGV